MAEVTLFSVRKPDKFNAARTFLREPVLPVLLVPVNLLLVAEGEGRQVAGYGGFVA